MSALRGDRVTSPAVRRGIRARTAATLIELLVTLALMGVVLGVATLAVRRIDPPPLDDPYYMIRDSLRLAVSTGRSSTIRLLVAGAAAAMTVNPDGSVVGDSVLGIERFTGKAPNGR